MKTSDEDLAAIQTVVERDAYNGEDEVLTRLFRELAALRKVAEGALALERAMEGIPCECVDKSCEVMCKALREAGL